MTTVTEHRPARFTSVVRRLTDRWVAFWFTSADPLPLSVIRILTGLMLIYSLAVWGQDLKAFFGSDGLQPLSTIMEVQRENYVFSFFHHVPDSWLWTVHVTCMAVAVLFCCGVLTRLTSVLAFLIAISYAQRVPVANFGLDQILAMLCLYLAMGPSGASLSIDAWIRQRWRSGRSDHQRHHASASAGLALRLIQVHVCIIYFWAGFAKLKGDTWWTGEAMWQVVANQEYQTMDLTWMAWVPWLPYLLAHITVAWEVSFCVAVWNSKLRPFWLTIGTAMHFGIGAFLGMWTFGLVMTFPYLAFADGAWWRSRWERGGSKKHEHEHVLAPAADVALPPVQSAHAVVPTSADETDEEIPSIGIIADTAAAIITAEHHSTNAMDHAIPAAIVEETTGPAVKPPVAVARTRHTRRREHQGTPACDGDAAQQLYREAMGLTATAVRIAPTAPRRPKKQQRQPTWARVQKQRLENESSGNRSLNPHDPATGARAPDEANRTGTDSNSADAEFVADDDFIVQGEPAPTHHPVYDAMPRGLLDAADTTVRDSPEVLGHADDARAAVPDETTQRSPLFYQSFSGDTMSEQNGNHSEEPVIPDANHILTTDKRMDRIQPMSANSLTGAPPPRVDNRVEDSVLAPETEVLLVAVHPPERNTFRTYLRRHDIPCRAAVSPENAVSVVLDMKPAAIVVSGSMLNPEEIITLVDDLSDMVDVPILALLTGAQIKLLSNDPLAAHVLQYPVSLREIRSELTNILLQEGNARPRCSLRTAAFEEQ